MEHEQKMSLRSIQTVCTCLHTSFHGDVAEKYESIER